MSALFQYDSRVRASTVLAQKTPLEACRARGRTGPSDKGEPGRGGKGRTDWPAPLMSHAPANPNQQGVLRVTVIECKDLKSKDFFSKNDVRDGTCDASEAASRLRTSGCTPEHSFLFSKLMNCRRISSCSRWRVGPQGA